MLPVAAAKYHDTSILHRVLGRRVHADALRRQSASTRFFRWRLSGPGGVPTKNGIPRLRGIALLPGTASATTLRRSCGKATTSTSKARWSAAPSRRVGKGNSKITMPFKAWQVKRIPFANPRAMNSLEEAGLVAQVNSRGGAAEPPAVARKGARGTK